MTNDDVTDYEPSRKWDDEDDDDSITITIGKKKKKKPPIPMPEPTDEKAEPRYTFSSKKEYMKELKGERARQEAIAKAKAKYDPLQKQLDDERENTRILTESEYVPPEPKKKGTFCERHPNACKVVGKGPKAKKSIPAPKVSDDELRAADAHTLNRKLAKRKKEIERQDRINNGTDTYCDRHPKLCKAGKIAGGTALAGAIVAGAMVDPVGAGVALGMMSSPKSKKTATKSKSAAPKTVSKKRTASGSRTASSKARSPAKRTSSTVKRGKTSQNAQKRTQKRTTVKRATKSTPKKKSPKRPRKDDWWGAGDAGL